MATSPDKSGSCEAIVLFSGGIDSLACIHLLRSRNLTVSGLFVNYSQAAGKQEELAVAMLSQLLSIQVCHLRMDGFGCFSAGELPGRNSLLISAALFASRRRSCLIGMGIHSGTGYYDCSQQYLDSMNMLVSAQSDGHVSIVAPFLNWTKQDIYDYAIAERLPIAHTYSCENGTHPTCGLCASCRDRKVLGC